VPDAGAVAVTAVSVANPQQAASAVVNISPATQGGAVVTIVSPATPPFTSQETAGFTSFTVAVNRCCSVMRGALIPRFRRMGTQIGHLTPVVGVQNVWILLGR
jgi:hypothetical protein